MYCEIDAKKFQGVINLLNEMASECVINASKSGMTVRLVDGANVAMVEVNIPNTTFKSFSCGDDCKYGVDIAKLQTALKKSTRFGDTVRLILTDNVTFKRGNYSTETYLIPIDTIRKEPRIPSIQISNQFIISSDKLLDTFNCIPDRYIHVKQNDGSVSMYFSEESSRGTETTTVTFGDEITITRGVDAHSYYNLEYLRPAMKVIVKMADTVSFEFGNDWPCIVSNTELDIKFKMLLAPRIESD